VRPALVELATERSAPPNPPTPPAIAIAKRPVDKIPQIAMTIITITPK
jgi:hypothetical protein